MINLSASVNRPAWTSVEEPLVSKWPIGRDKKGKPILRGRIIRGALTGFGSFKHLYASRGIKRNYFGV